MPVRLRSGMPIVTPAAAGLVATPNLWYNVILSGVLGLLVGIMLAFALEYLGRSHVSVVK